MNYGRFRVIGSFRYLDVDVGGEFEAKITPKIARAVKRGNIVCLELFTPKVPDGFRLPKGWLG